MIVEKLLKFILYGRLSEDLNAQSLLAQELDLSIDEALKIMFDFKENDKIFGETYWVNYFVV